MASLEQADQKVVYGLDIGTRSVVGTVGYMNDNQFNVIAQAVEKHETRAMLDGQIHDIGKVGATIRKVTDKLEQQTDIHLTDVKDVHAVPGTFRTGLIGFDHRLRVACRPRAAV